MDIPEWLNEGFLSTVLQGSEDAEPKVSILSFSPSLAVAPGNNYLSHMFRVKVEFKVNGSEEVNTTSLMVKAPFTKGVITEMSEEFDVFATELRAYTELLPLMHQKSNINFGPKCYYCPVKGIVLKDLKEDGYIMCDRLNQLDFQHCKIALTTLAKFHAASISCYHENPELISGFKEQMLAEGKMSEEQFGTWFHSTFKRGGDALADAENCELVANYIIGKSDGEELMKSIINLLKPKEQGINVLSHGDFWTNNMMFKHNESGEAESVKFIDFQMLKFTSPAIDLLYFVWTSANVEARQRRKELFSIYRQTLNSTLEELQCEERLSEEELNHDLESSFDFVIHLICFLLPYVLGDPENVVNLEDLTMEDMKDPDKIEETCSKVFKGKYFTAALPKLGEELTNLIISKTGSTQ